MRKLLAIFLLFATSAWLVGDDANARRIMAVYGDAISTGELPPGWRFETIVEGAQGDEAGYRELTRIEFAAGTRRSITYGYADAEGGWIRDMPSHRQSGHVYSNRDAGGRPIWAVAAYTVQDDSMGEVWLTHGNLLNRGYRHAALLRIYLNDELLSSVEVPQDRTPTLFQQRLGVLKRGDVVRVAVAPAEGGDVSGGTLSYVLEEFDSGHQPAGPINVLAPAIGSAEPKRSADGGYATYAARHMEQCELVLARQPELVFIGDSITARWPQEMLEANYGAFRPVNLGIGGDWIQNVLWRVQNGVLGQVRIKTIVVLIGTNNIANRFPAVEIAGAVDNLLQALEDVSPESRVLLLGILPRARSTDNTVATINGLLANLADDERVFFLDVGYALVEPDGSIAPEVMPDGLHVAMPGFERWMKAMKPKLDEVLARAGEE